MDAVATARGRLRATENDFTRAFEAMEASRDQKLVDKANSLDGDKAALDKANASADPKLVKALAEREAALKAANTAAQAAARKLEKIQREQQQDANRLSSQGALARDTIVHLAQHQGKQDKVYRSEEHTCELKSPTRTKYA